MRNELQEGLGNQVGVEFQRERMTRCVQFCLVSQKQKGQKVPWCLTMGTLLMALPGTMKIKETRRLKRSIS